MWAICDIIVDVKYLTVTYCNNSAHLVVLMLVLLTLDITLLIYFVKNIAACTFIIISPLCVHSRFLHNIHYDLMCKYTPPTFYFNILKVYAYIRICVPICPHIKYMYNIALIVMYMYGIWIFTRSVLQYLPVTVFFNSNHCLSEPDVIGINYANNRPD